MGWIPLLVRAAREVRLLLGPGEALVTRQVKEKFGTLRWYASVTRPDDDYGDDYAHPVSGVLAWAEAVSARLCAVHGTPDGELDQQGGWWLTLSPLARDLRRDTLQSRVGQGVDAFVNQMYPPWRYD